MKRFLAFGLFFIAAFVTVKAQLAKDFFDTDGYRHTINYADYKATFYTLPVEQAPGFAATGKKYYWYGNNHISITQGGFSGKLLNGLYSEFYHNKNLKMQGNFTKGLKTGTWKLWAEDGMITTVASYRKGELDGTYRNYNPAGTLTEEWMYRKDQLNGTSKIYTSADSVQVKTYRNGVLQPVKTKNFKSRILNFFKKKNNKKL